ncbi:MAG: hypothetical protein JNK82_36015 [Myxococcaceae bacterium]|nr:hypothetical protein [Myxococcaceae bacterium]
MLFVGCAAARPTHLLERSVAGGEGLECRAFVAWNHEPVRDAFLVINGSGTLSNAFVHRTLEGLLKARHVAYATYDKPGVFARFGDPQAVKRDDARLERYTLGHGTQCAIEALHLLRAQLGPQVRLHVRAHSEGTLVALYAYDELLAHEPELASRIATFVLSGLPVEPLGVIVDRQLEKMPDGASMRAAFAACDWQALEPRMGVSCAWLEDAKRRPSGREMFERLAAQRVPARFVVFHGTEDWHAPVAAVRELEVWNAAHGHLAIDFHYHEGGHQGSDAARAEVEKLFGMLAPD